MFHHSSKTSKSARVFRKDSGNLGLHHSFRAHATTVNERSALRQSSGGENKTAQENEHSLIVPSVSNPIVNRSAKFRMPPYTESETRSNFPETVDSVCRNTQMFHELNKIQRQILHTVPASITDSYSLPANYNKDVASRVLSRHNSSSTDYQKKYFSDIQLPGDRVQFTEATSNSGVPVVYRLPEDRQANPDRLNLDRRKLSVCPIVEGEENVRLLNFQHNLITEIENISQLKKLIFLDFYDNQLESTNGLSSLKTLRVLLLGKNRIKNIENLDALTKLDVLDMHGNQISQISNVNHLTELRVLNIASNNITEVRNVIGMKSLVELNLRRNKVSSVFEVDQLPNLQRLFLSVNEIESFDDMRCVSQCTVLSELCVEENPFSAAMSYKHCVLKNIPSLRHLDTKRISEEEKRLANVMTKREDEKKKEIGRVTQLKEKKKMAINNAQKQWEMFHVHSSGSESVKERSEQILSKTSSSEILSRKAESDYSISHLAELEGEIVYLYGPGSLDSLDRNWGQQAANTVTHVVFKFIDFDHIVPYFSKMQAKFPIVQKLVFTHTNIKSLPQINALAVIKHLESLTISEDNPVTCFTLWKPYTLFRLAHLSLRQLNDLEITGEDIVKSEKLFGPLSHFTTSSLPQSRLLSLLGNNRQHQGALEFERLRKTEGKHERSLSNEGLGRAGLRYQTPRMLENNKRESKSCDAFSEEFVRSMVQTCVSNHEKTKKVEILFPKILHEVVQEYVREMKDFDKFVEKSLEEI